MGLKLHKPGQGYWVRVLTAGAVGAILMATCAWLWSQVPILVPVPTRAHAIELTAVSGPLPAGAQVSLIELRDGAEVQIGSATVETYAAGSGQLGNVVIAAVKMNPGSIISSADRLTAGEARAEVRQIADVKLFDILYVQAGVVAAVIIGGVLGTYWLVGAKPATAEFLIATDGEMKKVNWSTRKDVIGSTWVVIGASLLIAFMLFVVDAGFSQFFDLIGVLDR